MLKSARCRSACRTSRAASDSPMSIWWFRGHRTTCKRWEWWGRARGHGWSQQGSECWQTGLVCCVCSSGSVAQRVNHCAKWGHVLSFWPASPFFHGDEHHREEISQENKVTLINNDLICQVSVLNLGCTFESSGELLRNADV